VSPYKHAPHPRIARRREEGPVKVAAQHPEGSRFTRFNTRLGLLITTIVGTMVCGYIFCAIALISLPAALRSGNLTIIIAWVSSNFLQLVLLPVIIVGQNAQASAADKRAEQTYNDAEAVLHEAIEIQKHLMAQDEILSRLPMLTHRDGGQG
jgi:hypothetical protein